MDRSTPVGIIGAGTMGMGIAQVAATAGHPTFLYDTRQEAVEKAMASLARTLSTLVDKGKLPGAEAEAILGRIRPAALMKEMSGCGLVIEAVVEDIAVKRKLFQDIEAKVGPEAVLATNTSSLSVTEIGAACTRPERVIGLHFFNPAPLLPLVEVIPGLATDPGHRDACVALMSAWGKSPVVCKDTPGFIVNRVARPFYGESLRILEEGGADIPTIDRAMKEVGGFRMGPFELMDLIGNDVNYMVTRTVWESFFYDPRYRPSFIQQRLVQARWLGRKSGRGHYRYDANGAIDPGSPQGLAGVPHSPKPPEVIVRRVLVMLINEAIDAVHLGIATRDDIDLAMAKGVNYPKGLLKWADELGLPACLAELERLQAEYGEDRYRPSPLLRRMVREGLTFY
jgi:3-hydroxybutyryl-CoA dehydrogenase